MSVFITTGSHYMNGDQWVAVTTVGDDGRLMGKLLNPTQARELAIDLMIQASRVDEYRAEIEAEEKEDDSADN